MIFYVKTACLLFVAFLHFVFAWKEYFGREKVEFYKNFSINLNPTEAKSVGKIVANSALFNLLLAIGLVVSLIAQEHDRWLQVYLLLAIIVAGIVGGKTLAPKVGLMQAGPAIVTLVVVCFSLASADSSSEKASWFKGLPWYDPYVGLVPIVFGVVVSIGLIASSFLVYREPKNSSLVIGLLTAWTFLPLIWFLLERHWLFAQWGVQDKIADHKEAQQSMATMWAAFAGFMFCIWTVANERLRPTENNGSKP